MAEKHSAEKFSRRNLVDDLMTEEYLVLYFQACVEEDPGDGKNSRLRLFIRL